MNSPIAALVGADTASMERIVDLELLGPRLLFGNGASGRLVDEAARLGGARAMIVTDRGVRASGLLEPLIATLSPVAIFDDIAGEPSWTGALDGARAARDGRCDLIVGVGGGSSLDTAKAIAVLATVDSVPVDYWAPHPWPAALPKILLPTTSGTGSELTSAAVFTDADGRKKAMRGPTLRADVAIVDPLLTLSLPHKPTAESGMDALIHAIEAFTSRRATVFGDLFAERAIELAGISLVEAFRNGANIAPRYRMSLASTLGGAAAMLSGVGAVHALTYPLSTAARISHGLANSILLPHVARFNLPAATQRYARVASLLGCEDPIARMVCLQESLDLPTRLRDFGVESGAFPSFAAYAFEHFSGNLTANARQMTPAEAVALYRAAM